MDENAATTTPKSTRLATLSRDPITPTRRPLTQASSSSTNPKLRQNTRATPGNSAGRNDRDTTQQFTPHGARALQQLRVARQTPGRNRRRSGQMARETPRGILRALSRTLAPISEPIRSSPQFLPPSSRRSSRFGGNDGSSMISRPSMPLPTFKDGNEDLDEGDDVVQPRMSMSLLQDEDDSFEYPPPRLSVPLEDENITQKSIEYGRRAVSEQPLNRLSRGSFGNIRLSEYFDDTSKVFDNDVEAPVNEEISHLQPHHDEPSLHGTSKFSVGPGNEDNDTAPAFDQSLGPPDESFVLRPDIPNDTEEVTFQLENEHILPEAQSIETAVIAEERAARTFRPMVESFVETATGGVGDVDANALESEEPQELFVSDSGGENEEVYNDEEQQPELETLGLPNESENAIEYQEQEVESDASRPQSEKENPPIRRRPAKIQKVSRYGTKFPSLPSTMIKNLATRFSNATGSKKSKLNKDCLNAIEQASDWFFEQIGDDLRSYSDHAGRKTIDETDVITLMRRQRQLKNSVTLFSLGQKYLPKELLQEVRMGQPS